MRKEKPLIVITNDDGITSKGIRLLIEYVRSFGEIVVVAPDSPRSGAGASLTVHVPIHFQFLSQEKDITYYKCSGTPVDCVKIAVSKICTRRPDLLIAGINHGDNSATNVYNSGTMGAVIEGCLGGIKSVAFSLCSHDLDADFSPMEPYVRSMTDWALHHELPALTCLNINFPYIDEYKGVRICNMARGYWEHEFDPCPRRNDENYVWLAGNFVETDNVTGESDRSALGEGYIAITPTRLDVTDYKFKEILSRELNSLLP